MQKLRFSKEKKVLKYQNKVLYANTENGKWIRVSEEIEDILSEYLKHSHEYFIKNVDFETSEDEQFFLDVINRMVQMGILESENKVNKAKNSSVSIEITNKCNLRCKHCCVNAGDEADYEFSTIEIKDILRKCVDWDPYCITLSGGEPMIRKDFFEILSYLRNIFTGAISLSTNGMFITKSNVEELCMLVDQIDISIDGVDENSCSKIRGAGVFQKVLESIDILHKNNFSNISLSMVFSDTNEYLEKEFYQLNERLGTKALPRVYADMGRGKENREQFTKKDKNESYIPSSFLTEENTKNMGFCSCSAGKKMIFIRHDGSIYPCPSYMKEQYLMGNVLKINSLNEVTAENMNKLVEKYMISANMMNHSKCNDCPVKYFCWSCLGDTDRFPTETSLNSYCKLAKPILMKRVWA